MSLPARLLSSQNELPSIHQLAIERCDSPQFCVSASRFVSYWAWPSDQLYWIVLAIELQWGREETEARRRAKDNAFLLHSNDLRFAIFGRECPASEPRRDPGSAPLASALLLRFDDHWPLGIVPIAHAGELCDCFSSVKPARCPASNLIRS